MAGGALAKASGRPPRRPCCMVQNGGSLGGTTSRAGRSWQSLREFGLSPNALPARRQKLRLRMSASCRSRSPRTSFTPADASRCVLERCQVAHVLPRSGVRPRTDGWWVGLPGASDQPSERHETACGCPGDGGIPALCYESGRDGASIRASIEVQRRAVEHAPAAG